MENNTAKTKDRIALGTRASLVGILCNLLLFAGKCVAGIFLRSTAVTADAFNNLSDAGSSMISFFGIRMSVKPADREHPFGHGRMEYIAALVVSFLIMEIGLTFFKESIAKIVYPEAMTFSLPMLLLLVVTIFVKIGLFFFDRHAARKTNSASLKNAASDCLSDAAITSVTVISVLVEHFSGKKIDGFAGLLVSLIVIWAGITIIRDTMRPLLGQELDEDLSETIDAIVRRAGHALDTHDLIIHNYGHGRNFATIHMELPKDLSIEESHLLADHAEKEVFEETGVQLVIHVDPADTENARSTALKARALRIISILDPELSLHDFHITETEDSDLITFDLSVPFSYDEAKSAQITDQVRSLMCEMDDRVKCEIKTDRGFFVS